jgi:GAF domain-containing protein
VPLAHEGKIIGVLTCYAGTPNGFTEDNLRLLELLAASLASAVASVATKDVSMAQPKAPRILKMSKVS